MNIRNVDNKSPRSASRDRNDQDSIRVAAAFEKSDIEKPIKTKKETEMRTKKSSSRRSNLRKNQTERLTKTKKEKGKPSSTGSSLRKSQSEKLSQTKKEKGKAAPPRPRSSSASRKNKPVGSEARDGSSSGYSSSYSSLKEVTQKEGLSVLSRADFIDLGSSIEDHKNVSSVDVKIKLIRAEDLAAKDRKHFFGKKTTSDPYCEIFYNGVRICSAPLDCHSLLVSHHIVIVSGKQRTNEHGLQKRIAYLEGDYSLSTCHNRGPRRRQGPGRA
jgi:hypothetical protein